MGTGVLVTVAIVGVAAAVMSRTDNESGQNLAAPVETGDTAARTIPQVQSTAPNVTVTTPSVQENREPDSVPADTVAPTADPSPGGAVSYRSPPPALPMRHLWSGALSTIDRDIPIIAAIGDRGVAVNQTWSDSVLIVGFDGSSREVAIDTELGAMAFGPGDVVYALRSDGRLEDFAMVAVPVDGERAGEVVSEVPLSAVTYMELPDAAFGHGPRGIIDRARDVNATLMPYFDASGQPVVWEPAVPLVATQSTRTRGPDATYDSVLISGSDGTSWRLDIEAAPGRGDGYTGPDLAAPSSDDLVVYWTDIGPKPNAESEYAEPSTSVLATLHRDGTAHWWSVPEPWRVVASDEWGTVLAKLTGASLELALADIL